MQLIPTCKFSYSRSYNQIRCFFLEKKMPILHPNKNSFRFKRISAIAFCMMTFDALVLGIPSFGFIISFFIILASLISSLIFLFKNKTYSKLFAIKAGIYFIALICIIGIFRFNAYIGKKNSKIVIGAINTYYAEIGIYPERLNQLMPSYLENLPNCAYRIIDRKYRYIYSKEHHYLIWAEAPPFGRRIYNFKTEEWRYLD